MRLNSKGQVTIPAALRAKHGLHEGDEVDVVEEAGVLRIVRARDAETRGRRLARHMRGRGSAADSAELPYPAGFLAGKAYLRYRSRAGPRTRIVSPCRMTPATTTRA